MSGITGQYFLEPSAHWLATLEAREIHFRTSLARARQAVRTPHEGAALDAIGTLFDAYENDLEEVLAFNRAGEVDRAKHLLANATSDAFESTYQKCEEFVRSNEQLMVGAVSQIGKTNRTLRAVMYGIGLSGLAMGCLLGLLLARSVTKPIYELVLKVRGATGDEVVERVDMGRNSELQQLDHHVHELIARINTARSDLEKNRRLLARTDRLAALGRVSAGVAHEIRNPLTAIKLLVYGLRQELAGDDGKRRDLEVLGSEIDRMERFVESFLRFARPPEPSLRPVSVNDVVHETLSLVAPRLRQSGTGLIEQYDPSLEPLLADPDQIRQVVMNLALNAAEAMPEGGSLTVGTERVAGPNGNGDGRVQIRFTDTGPGIAADRLDEVFDPFVSGHDDGIGLGLSVSYQIVRLHHGWIDVANVPGGGASFTVSLPQQRG
jgi:signal transduction histidine kinase